jgi:hypothetical protein
MREDMKFVVNERGRYTNRYNMRANRRQIRKDIQQAMDGEDHPECAVSMRSHLRNRGYEGIQRHLHYAPLIRFLKSRVGQPWDKVFSEIKEVFTDEASQRALRCIHWNVVLNTSIRDGVVYLDEAPLSRTSISIMYVHPTTGLLCCAPGLTRNWWRTYGHISDEVRKMHTHDNMKQFWRIDDVWYEFTFIPYSESKHDILSDSLFEAKYGRYIRQISNAAGVRFSDYDKFVYITQQLFGAKMLPSGKRAVDKRYMKQHAK